MQGKCWVEGRQSDHTIQSIPSLVLTSLPLGLEQKLQVGPASSSLSKARCKSRCHATAMRASESELVSYHKNIQEWTNIWNLSTPRSCNPGSNRKNEETQRGLGGCFVCVRTGVCGRVSREHGRWLSFILDLTSKAVFL